MSFVKRTLRRAVKYAGARLWEQVQWPEVEVIHARSGIFGVVNFLQQSGDPDLTKRVLARYGADIHPDCWPIGPNITLHDCPDGFANLVIGPHVHIGREVFLDLSDRIVMEESVSIAMRAIILTHLNPGQDYPNKPVARLFPPRKAPTILRRGCSVGAGAIIACGVEIGEDAVVNAGVLIDRNVPPRTFVASSRQKRDLEIPLRLVDKLREPR